MSKKKQSNVLFDLRKSISAPTAKHQQRFYYNTMFLLQYTAMSLKSLASRARAMGCPSPRYVLKAIEQNRMIGIDMIQFSVVAKIFGVPFELMFEHDITELYEKGILVPEKYGIFKHSMARRKSSITTYESKIQIIPWRSVQKKMKRAVDWSKKSSEMEINVILESLRNHHV